MRFWVRGLDPNAEPRKVVELGGETFGSPPVWSPDGKQLIISVGRPRSLRHDLRVNIDGTGREELAVPPKTMSRIGPPTADGS